MSETFEQYVARIRSYMGGRQPLEILAETSLRLEGLLAGVPDAKLRARPQPEKWSVLEQVAHLSDVEIVIGFRTRFVLGAPEGAPIVAFDQDRWQQTFRYNEGELAPTLAAFAAARENNLRLYRSLDETAWNKYGIHSERGKETVRDIVALNAGHDVNHLRQIEALLGKAASAGSHPGGGPGKTE